MSSNDGCPDCTARISVHFTECPWCGAACEQSDAVRPVPRRRFSLGALITISTLAAIMIWLASLGQSL